MKNKIKKEFFCFFFFFHFRAALHNFAPAGTNDGLYVPLILCQGMGGPAVGPVNVNQRKSLTYDFRKKNSIASSS